MIVVEVVHNCGGVVVYDCGAGGGWRWCIIVVGWWWWWWYLVVEVGGGALNPPLPPFTTHYHPSPSPPTTTPLHPSPLPFTLFPLPITPGVSTDRYGRLDRIPRGWMQVGHAVRVDPVDLKVLFELIHEAPVCTGGRRLYVCTGLGI